MASDCDKDIGDIGDWRLGRAANRRLSAGILRVNVGEGRG